MSQVIRSQRKCYFASGEYAESFWGRNIYLYQGQGGLRLTTDGLKLSTQVGEVEIPFKHIKGVSLTQFSSWSKPFGLSRLTIHHFVDDELRTIHLVPYESAMDPTWTTSKLVEDWFQTLSEVEELTGRIESPTFFPVQPPSSARFGPIALCAASLAIGLVLIIALIGF